MLTKGRLAKEASQKPFGFQIYKLGYDEVNCKGRRACLARHWTLPQATLGAKGEEEGEKLLPEVW
ncbi:hypothetical protein BELL_0045g00220 [Botrytis elliptica]|uniref:Uncharacterized protein n=1 Tax=Botrytis elliptica TaxID=278938 RepID=A0A4Z1JYR3_9HELO|nr:hypothetical protein BELL_0045g00220 [Botrytis elliptica]